MDENYQLQIDLWSAFIIVAELSIFLFIGLFGPTIMISATYINVLTIAGLSLGLTTGVMKFGLAAPPKPRELLIYTGVAFVGILLLNTFVNLLPALAITNNVSASQIIVLEISAAEETWFRGFLAPFFASRIGLYRGLLAQGSLFAVYHLAVYGDNVSALLIIAGAGFILGYVDIKTKSLFPSLAAHFLNNLFSSGLL